MHVDDLDFISLSNERVTIPAGSLMAGFNITIRGDSLAEEDEQFTFNISTVNPSDRVVSPSQGTVTILNDDGGENYIRKQHYRYNQEYSHVLCILLLYNSSFTSS